MRKVRQIVSLVLISTLLLLIFIVPSSAKKSNNVALSTSRLNVRVGAEGSFTITLSDAVGRIDVTSSDPEIVSVEEGATQFLEFDTTPTGTVVLKGQSTGTATITVTLTDVLIYSTEEVLAGTYKIDVKVVDDDQLICQYLRVAGKNRYATSEVVANANAKAIGCTKYDSIILVTGKDFADALSATYLSAMLGAPIISTKPEGMADTTTYITAHLNNGGKVYVVGGENAISSSYFTTLGNAIKAIPDTSIERLAGKNRYKTNAIVLEKAYEIEQEKGLACPEYAFICTGTGYADALSASAVGAPIILVKPETGLCDEQKAYLEKRQNDSKAFDMLYVIGGDKAVSDANANAAKAYTNDKSFTRLGGANRYATSKLVADTFFDNTSATNTIVLAYAKNYPDALAGGLLAYSLHAPLILTVDDNNAAAKEYVTSMDGQIEYAVVLGGSGLVSDATVNTIMGTSGVAVENFD